MHRPFGEKNAVRLATVWVGNAFAFALAFLDFDFKDGNLESLFLLPLVIAFAAVLNGLIDPVFKERMVFFRWKHPFPAARAFYAKKYIRYSTKNGDNIIDSASMRQPSNHVQRKTTQIAQAFSTERSGLSDLANNNGSVTNHASRKWLAYFNWKAFIQSVSSFFESRSKKSAGFVKHDGRINEKRLRRKERGTFPKTPERQYAVWFKYYVEVQDNPSVLYRRRDYMFARDCASTAAVIFVLTTIVFFLLQPDAYLTSHFPYLKSILMHLLSYLGIPYSKEWNVPILYLIFTLAQYIVLRWMAARHGRQFTTTVLAVASAK